MTDIFHILYKVESRQLAKLSTVQCASALFTHIYRAALLQGNRLNRTPPVAS